MRRFDKLRHRRQSQITDILADFMREGGRDTLTKSDVHHRLQSMVSDMTPAMFERAWNHIVEAQRREAIGDTARADALTRSL